MAGLAVLLRARGCEVSGCDLKETLRTKWLGSQGIRVFIGHSPEHLAIADEVIVTPAVSPAEGELLRARARSIPVRCRGEVLAELVNGSDGIAVCGSHGKTTTATWIAKLLLALGENVSWCIGGETGSFPVAGTRQSDSPAIRQSVNPLVVEADESDGTLALYRAKTLVVNKCEYDHPDHFTTEADYFACYERAKQPAGEVIEAEGLGGLEGLEGLGGLAPHNRTNARAAVEVALRRGHSIESIAKALPAVVAELPDRRFQKIAEGVYIDYGHHPTDMKCAVQMARARCQGRLRVLFQPHRYSRTKALLGDFPAAFDGADEVVLCPTYAAFEQPVEGGDVADLYAACRAQGVRGLYLARSCEEAWTHAKRSAASGDLTLVLGAGDIVNRLAELPPQRLRIGAGANTWKSDLNLPVEYVKTSGPAGTFGSFFKNPAGDSAGRLLEAAGAKDLRVGGAYVWRERANVIVRGEGATPSDVLALAHLMRNRVLFRFGVSLEPEVQGVAI